MFCGAGGLHQSRQLRVSRSWQARTGQLAATWLSRACSKARLWRVKGH